MQLKFLSFSYFCCAKAFRLSSEGGNLTNVAASYNDRNNNHNPWPELPVGANY